ncbi:MAG TPA: nuclear transport factor 2 family protein [Vicinamibacteria bacterium]|nr:nuclear transport factor 2 family protein [Vicinamibacteria bacterium]
MLESLALALALAFTTEAPASEANLKRIVADYVGLYRRDSLPQWRALFLPSFTVASTNADGSVRLRNLADFYAAQERYLASGRAIEEKLENVAIERRGRLASVWADFVLTDQGETSRGKLCLSLIEEKGSWRIQSLVFAYDDAN